MTGFLMLLAAGALMFCFYYPRPKSYAERAGKRLKEWMDRRIGR